MSLSLKNILLPVDFSERSSHAAHYARLLAGRFQSTVTLLHALHPPHYELGTAMLGELYPDRIRLAEEELDSFAGVELPGISVAKSVTPGDAASAIVQHGHTHHSDLIVMPTHGYGPFRRFILGSTTAKVLHDADCPVLTGVHLDEPADVQSMKFESIICAVDFGAQSSAALKWAHEFSEAFEARLFVVHVLPVMEAPQIDQVDPGWQTSVSNMAGLQLDELQQEVGTNAMPIVTGGEPVKAVCRQVEELRADLLVIGRGSSKGVIGRLRTNSYALIRESRCPVVSV